MLKNPAFIGLCVLISVIFLSCKDKFNDNKKPNIILILVDDLGWNDLGYTGSNFMKAQILILYLTIVFSLLMLILLVLYVLLLEHL